MMICFHAWYEFIFSEDLRLGKCIDSSLLGITEVLLRLTKLELEHISSLAPDIGAAVSRRPLPEPVSLSAGLESKIRKQDIIQ